MRLRMLILIVGAIAIFAAGCGGGDSTSGGTTAEGTTAEGGGNSTTTGSEEGGESKPMTKSEFHTRINEICIQVPSTFEEELKELEKKVGKKPSEAETNLKAAIPPLESSIEQMESVVPPPKEEKLLEEVIAALKAAVKGIEEKPTSELSGPKSPFAEFQKITKENEFETCSGL